MPGGWEGVTVSIIRQSFKFLHLCAHITQGEDADPDPSFLREKKPDPDPISSSRVRSQLKFYPPSLDLDPVFLKVISESNISELTSACAVGRIKAGSGFYDKYRSKSGSGL